MAEKVVRIASVASVFPDREANAIQVGLVASDGQSYRLDIPEALLGVLVIGITSQTPALSPENSEFSQAMVLNRAEPVEIVGGGVGVNFLLENGRARLLVQIPKDTIPVFHALADALADLAGKGRADKLRPN